MVDAQVCTSKNCLELLEKEVMGGFKEALSGFKEALGVFKQALGR
jgi:hypothetical protein